MHLIQQAEPSVGLLPSGRACPGRRRCFHLLCLVAIFLFSGLARAAPVKGVFTYHQPDGSTLQVRVVGDEFFAEEETLDGRHIIQDPVTKFWCYAQLSKDGTALESTGIVPGDIDEPTALARRLPEHLRLKTPLEQRLRIAQGNRERLGRDAKGRIILRLDPPTLGLSTDDLQAQGVLQSVVGGTTLGVKKGLTLLVRFPDRAADVTITKAQVANFCNQTATHYTEFSNNGSVAEYFSDISSGKLSYTNTVASYYTAKQNRGYYTNESIPQGTRINELIKEALNALEAANFDFRTVDADGDGVIDALNCFYAGACVNAWAKGLWPCAGGINWSSAKTGMRTGAFQISDMGSKLELGTFCHENGHMLCHYPDVYDYDGDSQGGAGAFCLMDGGCFGPNPSAPNGYLRYKSGWGTAATITSSSNGTRTLTAENNGRLANQFLVYFNPANSQEYYLIENRYKHDRDAGLPTGGIAVWHVDEQGNHNAQNYAHQSSHNNFEVALIQADNQRHFERNLNADQAKDLFYVGGVSNLFSDTSDTGAYDNNAHWWNGYYSGLRLSGFSAQGNSMSLTVGTPSIGGPAGYTWCANEGGSSAVPGLCDVAYGANGTFTYKYGVTGTITFNNATFGDPVPGVTKAGYYKVCTTPPGFTKCANEGGRFTLPSLCDVAYGANGQFTYKYGVTGTVTFNNATFGDPIPGVAKSGFYKVRPSYTLRARHSGKVLDVAGVSTADGANVYQWTSTGAGNQRWQLQDAGNGYYYLRVQHSGKYLDVSGVSTAAGANVHQWTFTGAANQQWQLQNASNGYYYLKAKHSGMYLDVEGGSTADGGNVLQWPFTGGSNQQWRFEQVQ